MSYLEDPDVWDTAVTVMVSEEGVEELQMFCRGGENCCGRESNRLCAEGDLDLSNKKGHHQYTCWTT